MNDIIGEQTKYILVQTNTTTNTQQAVFYNEYNMTLTSSDVNQATKFDDLAKVQAIAGLQNQMATIFDKPFTYSVVQEDILRSEVVLQILAK